MEITLNSKLTSQVKILKAEANSEKELNSEIADVAQARNKTQKNVQIELSFNQQIIENTFKSTITEKPLLLLSRETIEQVIFSLNAKLEDSSFAIDDIQTAVDNGLDVSPEATADRIVSLSTSFFGAYREQHSELSDDAAIESFVSTISGGIDRGFEEARNILKSLEVLDQGDIASNIDKTYDLVQEGLDGFLDSFLTKK